LQSDPTKPYRVIHPDTAFRNIAAYGALLKVSEEEYWNTEAEVKYFANLCYRYGYEGKWRTFQEILERTTNFQVFEEVAQELLGKYTYFGNLKPLIDRYSHTVRRYDPEPIRRVKRKVRRRGYNDKGSLRPPHCRNRLFPTSDTEREDRRNLVQHPLLKEDIFSGVEDAQRAHLLPVKEPWFQKGGKVHDSESGLLHRRGSP
jgi:hypothetical protein